MERTGWINLTLLLAILAALLHVAGFVAPMWIWLDVDSFRVGVGLWFTTGCGLQGTCASPKPNVSFGYTTDDTWSTSQFNAVRGLETIAVAGAVLLLLFLVVYRLGYNKWPNMGQLNMVAFLTAVLNWMFILAGLIVYCAYYWPVVGTSPLINRSSFPWSLVMCLLAAFFFILVCVLIRVKCRDRVYLKHAIPISGDAKMDMHPVTKHGLMHRYFSPLYRGIRGNNNAIGYEGKSGQAMNTRLIGAEERNRVAAIDNVAFYDNGTAGEVISSNYRHLPIQSGHVGGTRDHHHHTESGVRRTLPTAVVTYNDTTATDINRLHHQHQNGMAGNHQAGGRDFHYQNGGVANPTYQRDDVIYTDVKRNVTHQTGGVTRDGGVTNGEYRSGGGTSDNVLYNDGTRNVTHQTGGMAVDNFTYHTGNDVTRHVTTLQTAGGATYYGESMTRDGAFQNGGNVTTEETVTYSKVKKPVITTTTTFVTEETRGTRLLENTTRTDSRFTNEEHQTKGGLTVTELESNDGNQHTSKFFTTTTLASRADSEKVKPYDDTYIYRPYSETEPAKSPADGERL